MAETDFSQEEDNVPIDAEVLGRVLHQLNVREKWIRRKAPETADYLHAVTEELKRRIAGEDNLQQSGTEIEQ